MTIPSIKNSFLNQWLELSSGAESPELFNLWTGLSGVAACLGRRNWFQQGRFGYIPNMYVILCGPPAVRKSSTGSILSKILRQYTHVKFGPDDTAGQRQGLMYAFMDAYGTRPKSDKEMLADVLLAGINNEPVADATGISAMSDAQDVFAQFSQKQAKERATGASSASSDQADKDIAHDLFVFCDELATFIGVNQIELINCLTQMFYPQDEYQYKLTSKTVKINKPGLNLLACTTPVSLVKHLPESAIGQGFSSRCIMVYQGLGKDKVFPAPALDTKLMGEVGVKFANLCSWDGVQFDIAGDALELQGQLYMNYNVMIEDVRFTHYAHRRGDHIIKLMMCLAAGRGDRVINKDDVIDAHNILVETEKHMHNALGELGMDKASVAKQQLREFIEGSAPGGVSKMFLKQQSAKNMKLTEFNELLNALVSQGVCVVTTAVAHGEKYELVVPVAKEIRNTQFL